MAMTRVYKGTSSIVINVKDLRRYTTSGWSQVPSGDTPPSLDSTGVEPDGGETSPGGATPGANLPPNTVVSLYNQGFWTYQQALAALQAQGYASDAKYLLVGQAPGETGTDMWEDIVSTNLLDALTAGATKAGFADPKSFATGFLDYHWDALQSSVFNPILGGSSNSTGPRVDPNVPTTLVSLISSGLKFLQGRWSWGNLPTMSMKSSGGGRGGGGGGGGNVRDRFDVDALADRVNAMWRTYLVADSPDARSIAQAYVDTIVSAPAMAVDFDTFVKARMKKDPKWGQVFGNKPQGISEEAYITQYAQMVMNNIGPAPDAPDLARGLAGANASPDAVSGALKFHPNITKSSGFLNRIEDRFRSVRDVLGAI